MPRPQPPLRRTGPRPVPNYNQAMPLVSLAASNLTYGESRYWQVTVTVTSNTTRSLDTQVKCSFLNAGRSVGEAYLGPVLMPRRADLDRADRPADHRLRRQHQLSRREPLGSSNR